MGLWSMRMVLNVGCQIRDLGSIPPESVRPSDVNLGQVKLYHLPCLGNIVLFILDIL